MARRTLWIYLFTSVLGGSQGSYDEYLTCDRLYETRRTARVLDHVPCDMRKQTYCEHKGSAYPEHAIWRFKEENKALMKRMYGDVESSEVYREMRSNSLFREERASSFAVNMIPFNDNMFNGLNYNIRVGSGLSVVKNAKEEKVRIRLGSTRTRARQGTTTTSTTSTSSSSSSTAEEEEEGTHLLTTTTTSSSSRVTTTQSVTATEPTQTSGAPSTIQPSTATDLPPMAVTLMADQLVDTVTPLQQVLAAATSTVVLDTLEPVMESRLPASDQPATEQTVILQADLGHQPPQTEANNPGMVGLTEDVHMPTTSASLPPVEAAAAEEREAVDLAGGIPIEEAGLRPGAASNVEAEQHKAESATGGFASYAEAMQATLTDLAPDQIEAILPGGGEEAKVEAADGILEPEEEEEDVEDDDGDDSGHGGHDGDSLLYAGESINACPVNEEVKAPFWANNTRNQVLALLNLYPFEQYIHMETCQHEYKEMLCRPGCRCEQQYRLHRLLAFDPNNECRGIFSDWFRFPSFCVCKCYSVPEQLVADLARNPRKSDFSPAAPRRPAAPHQGEHSAATEGRRGGGRLDNHRMSKKTRLFVDQELGIPAVFPYEGRAAIMAELTQGGPLATEEDLASWSAEALDSSNAAVAFSPLHRAAASAQQQPLKDRYREAIAVAAAAPPLLSQLESLDAAAAAVVAAADGHIDNTVESDQLHYRKSNKEARQLDDQQQQHFFYNQPIVEFRLPDGTTGTIDDKIPRRRK